MRRFRAIGRVGCYCLLCLGVETLVFELYNVLLDGLQTMGVFASVNDGHAVLYPYLSMVVRVTPALFMLWFFRMRGRSAFEELKLRPVAVSDAAVAAAVGVLSCLAVSYLLTVFPFPTVWQEEYTEQSSQVVMENSPIITVISTVILAPFAEEIVYRGILYGHLRRGLPSIAAALVSATLFGLAHGTAIWFVYTFCLGMLFAYMVEKTGSILPSMLSHVVFNFVGQIDLFPSWFPPVAVYTIYAMSLPLLITVVSLGIKRRHANV